MKIIDNQFIMIGCEISRARFQCYLCSNTVKTTLSPGCLSCLSIASPFFLCVAHKDVMKLVGRIPKNFGDIRRTRQKCESQKSGSPSAANNIVRSA